MMPKITDHALLRWLERCHGIPIDEYRKKMLEEIGYTNVLKNMAITKSYPTGDWKFIIENFCVTTVVPKCAKSKFGDAKKPLSRN